MLFRSKSSHCLAAILGGFMALLVLAGGGRGQDIDHHRFVSGSGKDTNTCVLTAPCRTFQRAVSTAGDGGVVVTLDSAEYGEFTTEHAVSVQAPPGVYAGILVEQQDGVTIEAGENDGVVLQGLTIHGVRGATNERTAGINFRTGGALHIEHCQINGNFVIIRGVTTGTDAGALFLNETTVTECVAGAVLDSRRAVIDSSRFEDNAGDGFVSESGISLITIRDTLAAGNRAGFVGEGQLDLERCVATSNEFGIEAGTDAIIRVSNSVVTHNTIGLSAPTNGQLLSRGNNTVEANRLGRQFTGTFSAK
jgi:hypothetical protein